jgi:hypothetical protein
MVAQIFIHPCYLMEEGSWEWWLHMCWMLPSSELVAGVTIAGVVAGVAWVALRHGQESA